MKQIGITVVLLMIIFQADVYPRERMAIVPFPGTEMEISTQQTSYLLLRSEIERSSKFEVIPESQIREALGDRDCSEAICAVDLGRRVDAEKVVFGSLNKLGEKIIVQYSLVEVPSGEIIQSDNISVLNVEDLDVVMKRVAASIVQQVPISKTVEVGTVTKQESLEPTSRKANSSSGIAFGYLYPGKGYDDKNEVFVWDFKSIYETRQFAVVGLLGLRQGVALNVGGIYLLSRRDFSPFIGAGLGFHAVSHEEPYNGYYDYDYNAREKKRGDGFEILANVGLLAFRTYDFRVLLNVDYSFTFNDYDDHGIALTIGIMRAGKKVFGLF